MAGDPTSSPVTKLQLCSRGEQRCGSCVLSSSRERLDVFDEEDGAGRVGRVDSPQTQRAGRQTSERTERNIRRTSLVGGEVDEADLIAPCRLLAADAATASLLDQCWWTCCSPAVVRWAQESSHSTCSYPYPCPCSMSLSTSNNPVLAQAAPAVHTQTRHEQGEGAENGGVGGYEASRVGGDGWASQVVSASCDDGV